ncbi:MAG TPA: tetratricopeptide repeat protein [Fimbriiglobus sp.]|nr:tetratricopeptide repeat protein [Fimbriiglobus sp.]
MRAVLRAADPDPYRDAVRDAVAGQVRARIAELAGRPDALVQPPEFAAALGQHPAVTGERERVILGAALRSRPGDLSLLMTLGYSYPLKNLRDGADERVRWFQAAVAAHPRNLVAYNNLGNALLAKGDFDGAIASYREAVRLDPMNANTHNALAWLLATGPDGVRDGRRAVEYAIQACELSKWKKPYFLDTLAAAYAEAGDFDKAMEYQKKALSFPDFEKKYEAEARRRLDLYAKKTPYRDPAYARREVAPPPRRLW